MASGMNIPEAHPLGLNRSPTVTLLARGTTAGKEGRTLIIKGLAEESKAHRLGNRAGLLFHC